MDEKETYKYHVMVGHKVVDRGITSELWLRELHLQEKWFGCRLKQIGRRTTREAALRWEREGGKRPYKRRFAWLRGNG